MIWPYPYMDPVGWVGGALAAAKREYYSGTLGYSMKRNTERKGWVFHVARFLLMSSNSNRGSYLGWLRRDRPKGASTGRPCAVTGCCNACDWR